MTRRKRALTVEPLRVDRGDASPQLRHNLAVAMLRAFGIKPQHIGVTLGCFCHSGPLPYGREYHRRRKARARRNRGR